MITAATPSKPISPIQLLKSFDPERLGAQRSVLTLNAFPHVRLAFCPEVSKLQDPEGSGIGGRGRNGHASRLILHTPRKRIQRLQTLFYKPLGICRFGNKLYFVITELVR